MPLGFAFVVAPRLMFCLIVHTLPVFGVFTGSSVGTPTRKISTENGSLDIYMDADGLMKGGAHFNLISESL